MKRHANLIIAIILIVVFATICTCFAIWTLKQPKLLSNQTVSSSSVEEFSSSSLESLEEPYTQSSAISENSFETNYDQDRITSSQSEDKKESTTTSSSTQTSSKHNNSNSSSKPTTSTSSRPVAVQEADPDTGISWDGKSPIIYTYPDGTTGTEKRDGATYEFMPGIKSTINFPKDLANRLAGTPCPDCGKEINLSSKNGHCSHTSWDGYCRDCGVWLEAYTCHDCIVGDGSKYYCSTCGKESDDGTNGTCVRWPFWDVDCPVCGENVSQNTCHTCAKGCKLCGKTPGDGTNGTCYRDCFGTSNCPSCGAKVSHNTCHMCEE